MRPSRRLPSHRTLSYRTLSQRMLKTVALLAAVFACAMAVWLWRDPLALVHAEFARQRWSAGLSLGQAQVAGHRWAYAVSEADVVNVATSGENYPYINEDWLKPGVFVSLPASIRMDQDFVLNRATLVIDNWKMYEAWAEELAYPFSPIMGLMGTYYLDWIHDGQMDPAIITNLGDIVSGKQAGRQIRRAPRRVGRLFI